MIKLSVGFVVSLCSRVQESVLDEAKVVRDKQISGGTRHPFYKSFFRRRIFERSCEPRARHRPWSRLSVMQPRVFGSA